MKRQNLQSHSSLGNKIWNMAQAIRDKYAAGKTMNDEDKIRVKSLETLAIAHSHAAIYQDSFIR